MIHVKFRLEFGEKMVALVQVGHVTRKPFLLIFVLVERVLRFNGRPSTVNHVILTFRTVFDHLQQRLIILSADIFFKLAVFYKSSNLPFVTILHGEGALQFRTSAAFRTRHAGVVGACILENVVEVGGDAVLFRVKCWSHFG